LFPLPLRAPVVTESHDDWLAPLPVMSTPHWKKLAGGGLLPAPGAACGLYPIPCEMKPLLPVVKAAGRYGALPAVVLQQLPIENVNAGPPNCGGELFGGRVLPGPD
jgi:hypothetical protein